MSLSVSSLCWPSVSSWPCLLVRKELRLGPQHRWCWRFGLCLVGGVCVCLGSLSPFEELRHFLLSLKKAS